MNNENDHDCTEIVFTGSPADVVIERLRSIQNLTCGMGDIDPRYLTAEDLARYLTFFQVVSFGESGRYDRLHGGRYHRNLCFARANPHAIGLSETPYNQTLILDGLRETTEIDLGFFDGTTIVYPLNATGAKLYSENRLPPHAFLPKHIVGADSTETASASFIGGAIHLPSIRDLMTAMESDERAGFEPFHEPPGICDAIGRRVVEFAPKVQFAIVDGKPTLQAVAGIQLPLLFSAISGRGHGERTLIRLGFVLDGRHIDHSSQDRRWVLDLNDLRKDDLSFERRIQLLNSWRWFLKHWDNNSELSMEIANGIREFVEEK